MRMSGKAKLTLRFLPNSENWTKYGALKQEREMEGKVGSGWRMSSI